MTLEDVTALVMKILEDYGQPWKSRKSEKPTYEPRTIPRDLGMIISPGGI
jgi:hypothetical protein